MADIELETLTLAEIIQQLRLIGAADDRMERAKEVESLKAAFYVKLGHLKAEAEAAGEEVAGKYDTEEQTFKSVLNDYKRERAEYNRKQDELRAGNLEIKLAIIEDLKALIEGMDDVNSSFPAFRDIQARWRDAGPVPMASFRDLNDNYQYQVERFYDMVGINHDLRDLDFKKNLEAKEELCAQAEALSGQENIVDAFNKLQKLHEQWKDLGPVAKEFRESIWERFKAATAIINKKYQDHFEQLKEQFKTNLDAKAVLCEKVEAIASREDVADAAEWNSLSREIEAIQAEWKTIGFATKKDNQKIYDRLRAACDKFYEKKRQFFVTVKDGMDANLEKKKAIVEQAEALKTSTDWKKAADQFISLQKQWKEIGTVPRKQANELWTRFRAACDEFFAERDKNAKPENDFYGNLKLKKAVIEEITAYQLKGTSEDARAAADFAARFKAIGFVPFKEKDNIAKAYKDAVREKFSKVRSDRDSLIKKYNSLQQDINTFENNIGFFSNSRNSESMISMMRQKLETAKAELQELKEKIRKEEEETEE